MFLARLSTNLQRKIDLTNAFKSFFRDDSFKPCTEVAGFLVKQGLGFSGGARARARAHSFGTCCSTYQSRI